MSEVVKRKEGELTFPWFNASLVFLGLSALALNAAITALHPNNVWNMVPVMTCALVVTINVCAIARHFAREARESNG